MVWNVWLWPRYLRNFTLSAGGAVLVVAGFIIWNINGHELRPVKPVVSKTAPRATPAAVTFQPTPPYYATFFYPWFRNAATDGSWASSIWASRDAGGSHLPARNWFSQYLPDLNPGAFDPVRELYSSNNYDTFKWQASKLAEAKQEVAIASWWGKGHYTDTSLNTLVHDFMARRDNPYPNLRWAIYYEKEGNVVDGTSDPSVATLVADLTYLRDRYGGSPYMLKIGGRPVVFVYADGNDRAGMAQRWKEANAQLGNAFYVNLKVFPGYRQAVQPDGWHQYAPAHRAISQLGYCYVVSPGFRLSGSSAELSRDLGAFQAAVTGMVQSAATWRLVSTWNEWGEGTAVEPGVEVNQANGKAVATAKADGVVFGNAYVQALADRLPALEAGTGR